MLRAIRQTELLTLTAEELVGIRSGPGSQHGCLYTLRRDEVLSSGVSLHDSPGRHSTQKGADAVEKIDIEAHQMRFRERTRLWNRVLHREGETHEIRGVVQVVDGTIGVLVDPIQRLSDAVIGNRDRVRDHESSR